MADEKKPEGKPEAKPAPPQDDLFVEVVSWLFVAVILMAAVNSIVNNINNSRLLANGWRGLTPKGILLSHTLPLNAIANPIGLTVVSVNDTKVYNAPAGEEIGKQRATARGVILQGPVEISGGRFWYVDYNKGVDGWVREENIAYLQSEPTWFERIIIGLLSFYWYMKIIVFILSILCAFLIYYLYKKITQLRIVEDKLLYPKNEGVKAAVNPKWQSILDKMDSLNENDWKQAILDADIMLADILDRLSLPGDTIGEKLKAVERSDFTTIDNAWEAHKVRNQIAHEGSSFLLNQREALRVMNLYKNVFEEFQII